MDLFSPVFDFVERVVTSVVAGVIVSKITQKLGNPKKLLNPFQGLKLSRFTPTTSKNLDTKAFDRSPLALVE